MYIADVWTGAVVPGRTPLVHVRRCGRGFWSHWCLGCEAGVSRQALVGIGLEPEPAGFGYSAQRVGLTETT